MVQKPTITIVEVDTLRKISLPQVTTEKLIMYSSCTHLYADGVRFKVYIREVSDGDLTIYVRKEDNILIA